MEIYPFENDREYSSSSSGCESGWTLYLDHSSSDQEHAGRNALFSRSRTKDEDEDLSMVSDASSGPPLFHGQDGFTRKSDCFHAANGRNGRHSSGKKATSEEHESSLLDDTASSPFFAFSTKNLPQRSSSLQPSVVEYSQGYSTTQYSQVRAPHHEHYEFFQSSILSRSQLHQNQQCEVKRW